MDRFQELSKIALDELSEVFARMSDENVRELLEEIKKADRIFLLGAGSCLLYTSFYYIGDIS